VVFLLIILVLIFLPFCFTAIHRRAEAERVKGQEKGSTTGREDVTIARVYGEKKWE